MEPLVAPPTHTAPFPAATLLGMPPAGVGPRSRVPVTWLDAGSTRHKRFAASLLGLALVTQTAPSPTATWWGRWSVVLGSRTLAATLPVPGSTRTSEPSPRLATHSAPLPAANSPAQQPGTSTTVDRLLAGSIWPRPRWGRATQTTPPATVSAPGARPTGIVATTRLVAGSIRTTAPSERRETQTAPAPTARPDGARPTGTLATTSLVAGSIRTTLLSEGVSTQTASSAAARRVGAAGRAMVGVSRVIGLVGVTHRVTQLGLLPVTQTSLPGAAIAIGSPNSVRVSTTRAGTAASESTAGRGSDRRTMPTANTAPASTAAATARARAVVRVRCRRRRRPSASSRSAASTSATLRSSAPTARCSRSSSMMVLPGALEPAGQGLAGAMQLGLDRPLGHAEGLGDLGHRGVGHIVQGDHLGLAPGQGPDGPPHLGVLFGQLGHGRAPAGQQPGQRPGLQEPPPHGPDGPADRHLAHPGRGAADVPPVAEGDQERLLGDVLSRQPASGQRVGQPYHRLVLAEVERLEPLGLGRRVERVERVDVRLHHRHPHRPRHSTP